MLTLRKVIARLIYMDTMKAAKMNTKQVELKVSRVSRSVYANNRRDMTVEARETATQWIFTAEGAEVRISKATGRQIGVAHYGWFLTPA